jgi:hypothetical protein
MKRPALALLLALLLLLAAVAMAHGDCPIGVPPGECPVDVIVPPTATPELGLPPIMPGRYWLPVIVR